MNRVTERDEYGNADIIGVDSEDLQLNLDFEGFNRVTEALNRLAAYEDTGLEPEEVEACNVALMGKSLAEIKEIEGISIDRMKDMAKAEAEGRLLVLPCKVGDMVYYVTTAGIYKAKAVEFRYNKSGVRVYCERKFMGLIGFEGIYGKTVFLTREDAEKALEGMENEL